MDRHKLEAKMQQRESEVPGSSAYLEKYLESLDNLPPELRRNLSLMKALDVKSRDMLKNVDKKVDEYAKCVRNLTDGERRSRSNEIQEMYAKVRSYGDDKVQIAVRTYEMVDKQIRKLDADMAKFETELKEKNSVGVMIQNNATKNRGRKKNGDKDGRKPRKIYDSSESDEPVGKGGQKKKKGLSKLAALAISSKASARHSADVASRSGLQVSRATNAIDMPVDPNEPTYCLCNQVSYGEMICCDNPDCLIEWFHFPCVNLSTKPRGKWYCPHCSADKKKK